MKSGSGRTDQVIYGGIAVRADLAHPRGGGAGGMGRESKSTAGRFWTLVGSLVIAQALRVAAYGDDQPSGPGRETAPRALVGLPQPVAPPSAVKPAATVTTPKVVASYTGTPQPGEWVTL